MAYIAMAYTVMAYMLMVYGLYIMGLRTYLAQGWRKLLDGIDYQPICYYD